MDSQLVSRINTLQEDLNELEMQEISLTTELSAVQNKIRFLRQELGEITINDRVAKDILERVYEQRRNTGDTKYKR